MRLDARAANLLMLLSAGTGALNELAGSFSTLPEADAARSNDEVDDKVCWNDAVSGPPVAPAVPAEMIDAPAALDSLTGDDGCGSAAVEPDSRDWSCEIDAVAVAEPASGDAEAVD